MEVNGFNGQLFVRLRVSAPEIVPEGTKQSAI